MQRVLSLQRINKVYKKKFASPSEKNSLMSEKNNSFFHIWKSYK